MLEFRIKSTLLELSLSLPCFLQHFPQSFTLKHSLSYRSNEKMVLRTSRNSSREVNIINIQGRISLCGGWRIFARENCIRVGDTCKFELLDRLEMMVHVATREEGNKQNNAASKVNSLKRTAAVYQPGLRLGN